MIPFLQSKLLGMRENDCKYKREENTREMMFVDDMLVSVFNVAAARATQLSQTLWCNAR